jgi:hypothetical protein
VEELIEAARTMVQAGIPCVVVKPGAKQPVPSSEGGWLFIEDEGGLEETLSNAYETNGGLNLAITAGQQQQRRSPVVVVDVDDEAGSRLARDLGFDSSHDCWLEITGSGHYAAVYYCRDTEGLKRRVHTGNAGLDLIVAGYQLIPPSITKGPYHWKPGHSPGDIPFSELQDLPLDDPSLDPFWQAVSDRGIYVFVHPLSKVISWNRMDADDLGRVLGWEFSLAVAALRIMNGGVLDRFDAVFLAAPACYIYLHLL